MGNSNCTKFLDIPVDGNPKEMTKCIKEKGFTEYFGKPLSGNFNGINVIINLQVYKSKVWRVVLTDETWLDKDQIRERYNSLFLDFNLNSHYIPINKSRLIEKGEDIAYMVKTLHKDYRSIYLQCDNNNKTIYQMFVDDMMSINLSNDETVEAMRNNCDELKELAYQKLKEIFCRKVWFRIVSYSDKYALQLFYDNTTNAPLGEDL